MITSTEQALETVLEEDLAARDKALIAVARRFSAAQGEAARLRQLMDKCVDSDDVHGYSQQHLAHIVRFLNEDGVTFHLEQVSRE